MSRFERRRVTRPDGSSFEVDLLVPPELSGIDASAAPGPLSAPMLDRARRALDAWSPVREDDAAVRTRLRAARERRRGEHEAGIHELRPGRAGTSDAEVERMVAAERLTATLAATDTAVTTTDIRGMHATLVGASSAAPWRRDVVWLGDARGPDPRARIQPAAPERIEPAMRALESFLAGGGDPIMLAAVAFAQLPAIHPWSDGNGRTGRLLSQVLLARARPDLGVAPDAAGVLAARWGDASVLTDAWLADGRLDEWIAGYCGAILQSIEPGRVRGAKRFRFRR